MRFTSSQNSLAPILATHRLAQTLPSECVGQQFCGKG